MCHKSHSRIGVSHLSRFVSHAMKILKSSQQPLLLPTWSSLIIAIKTLTRTQCQIFSCELKLLGDAKNPERKANSSYLTGSYPVV